jgi:protein TonB
MTFVLRLKSLGGGVAALGLSAVAHAAVVLTTTLGHPGASPSARNDDAVEVTTEVTTTAPESPAPEATPTPAAGHASTWPTHTHPYPVPADHDSTPHDPNLVHLHALLHDAPAAPQAPALAAPALTAGDDTPTFTISVSSVSSLSADDSDARGAVSPTGTAAPHEDSSEPVAERSVDGPARLVRGLAPSYPEAARAAGIEGDVRLELVVGLSGSVESARVVGGVGHGLDEAALQAVRQFRFAPATKDGRVVRVRMGWSMQFRLQ